MRTLPTLVLALLLAGTAARAAEMVMLTPNEGKSVTGELIKANREKVVLKVGEGDAAQEVSFTWEQIKKISNGITREKALLTWAKNHPELLCESCKGEGKVFCAACNGKGFLPDLEKVPCTKCAATGLMPCPYFSCKLGKVPCDGDCLRPEVGTWTKGKEGLMWRRYVFNGGFAEWSERHYGEVIKMKDGRPTNMGKCPKCKGTLKMDCPVCEGKKTVTCVACKGTKLMVPNCEKCKDGKSTCPDCGGSGEKAAKKPDEAKTPAKP
ncbi:MAG: hypothetical protein KIS92_12560 [Planctomycetota bacterium]|nr:hypothetical protein [Planctomycetota bacterium]